MLTDKMLNTLSKKLLVMKAKERHALKPLKKNEIYKPTR